MLYTSFLGVYYYVFESLALFQSLDSTLDYMTSSTLPIMVAF